CESEGISPSWIPSNFLFTSIVGDDMLGDVLEYLSKNIGLVCFQCCICVSGIITFWICMELNMSLSDSPLIAVQRLANTIHIHKLLGLTILAIKLF
ncbi:hypothetical protein ACJX0J_034622, partial [Zea mays]